MSFLGSNSETNNRLMRRGLSTASRRIRKNRQSFVCVIKFANDKRILMDLTATKHPSESGFGGLTSLTVIVAREGHLYSPCEKVLRSNSVSMT